MELKTILTLDTDEIQAGEFRIRIKAKPDHAKCHAGHCAFDQVVLGRSSPGMNPHDLIARLLIQTSWEPHTFLFCFFCPVMVPELHFQKSFLTTALPTGTGTNFAKKSWTLGQTILSFNICSHMRTNGTLCFFADRPTSQGNWHPRSGVAQSSWDGASNASLTTLGD